MRRTDAAVRTSLGVITEPRVGDEMGPSEGCLRAGDCRKVLIGDLERGGGRRMLALFRSVKTSATSGAVPRELISTMG